MLIYFASTLFRKMGKTLIHIDIDKTVGFLLKSELGVWEGSGFCLLHCRFQSFLKLTIGPNDTGSFPNFGTTIKSTVNLQQSSSLPKKNLSKENVLGFIPKISSLYILNNYNN